MIEKEFHIYTDGACKVNTGKTGSWGFVILDAETDEILHEEYGVVKNTTSSTMELKAAIQALGTAWDDLPGGKIIIHSDSKFVTEGIQNWVKVWKKRGWRTSNGKHVKHQELWNTFSDLYDIVFPEVKWVKGHDGNKWNEYVDQLCTKALNSI